MEEIINPGPETAAQPPLTRADLEAELAALTEAFQTRLDAQQQETKQQRQALETLRTAFSLTPISGIYDHVKAIQRSFDIKTLTFSQEYYDLLG